MNNRILILFLFISGFVNSQENQILLIGEWFSCDKRDFNVGDTINLQRDSCFINYEHNGNHLSMQVSFEFAKDHFSIHKNGIVLGGSSYKHYWAIKYETIILIGLDENEINETYEILFINSQKLTLLKMK